MRAVEWHNSVLESLWPEGRLRRHDLARIEQELERRGTMAMQPLASGLFPAAAIDGSASASGYGHVWVRDNVYVAYAHSVCGQTEVACAALRAIFDFFGKFRRRFDAIIAHEVDSGDVMQRPHVRFDGEHIKEISERWSHAQNDALGYALWLYARLAAAGAIDLDARAVGTLTLFPRYFDAIRFWEDEDSGHWEEARKQSASSIGTVVAGLDALRALCATRGPELRAHGFTSRLMDQTSALAARGQAALDAILPSECIQLSPRQNRRYDAALLFLVYPLEVVDSTRSELILSDIHRYLSGDIGVRRYLRDSYWAPDYDEHLRLEDRTRDFSEDMEVRDGLLDRIGHEAEWCIFDPILSAYYGRRYYDTGAPSDLERQELHLRRALAQITPAWTCPELYYRKHGVFVPNPNTPLRWTQANLKVALGSMHKNVEG